ncbi:MAG: ABC transporter permease subunit, partial [Phycisphaerae bacterium]
AIVACGLMLVIVIREIDISVGSLMAILAAALGRQISENHGNLTPLIGIPVILALGTASGVLTGVLVTYGNVPSIIVTQGLLSVYRGGATLLM